MAQSTQKPWGVLSAASFHRYAKNATHSWRCESMSASWGLAWSVQRQMVIKVIFLTWSSSHNFCLSCLLRFYPNFLLIVILSDCLLFGLQYSMWREQGSTAGDAEASPSTVQTGVSVSSGSRPLRNSFLSWVCLLPLFWSCPCIWYRRLFECLFACLHWCLCWPY